MGKWSTENKKSGERHKNEGQDTEGKNECGEVIREKWKRRGETQRWNRERIKEKERKDKRKENDEAEEMKTGRRIVCVKCIRGEGRGKVKEVK